MPEPRLMAVITALLMLAGTSPVRVGYDLDQLRQIEALILAKDCGALWEYLVSNPSIMTGEDALARELRVFVAATERGQIDCFAARPPSLAVVPPAPVVAFATGTVRRIEPY